MSALFSSGKILTVSRTRGTPVPSRSSSRDRSPSIVPGPPSRVPTTDNSQSSAISQDRPPAEHFLRGLIAPTDATNVFADASQILKRHHDGESADEPRPKRDKLGDELEKMHATLLNASSPSTEVAVESGVEDVRAPRRPDTSDQTADSESFPAIALRGGPPRQDNEATPAAEAAEAAAAHESRIAEPKVLGHGALREEETDDSGT